MTIKVTCDACGKSMNAKDDAAGKKAKCPGCGEVLQIPEAVYEAEEAQDADDDGAAYEANDAEAEDDSNRKPCPMCGEMIVKTAAKCRFCDTIFDQSLASSKRVKGAGKVDKDEIKKFRREMHALGGLWIFFGVVCLGLGVFLLGMGPQNRVPNLEGAGAGILLLGVCWLTSGVGTCVKQIWAVWMGVVLSGLSLLGNILQFNLCGLIFVGAALAQGWRCLGVAKKMKAAGIPLDTKP